MNLYYGLAVIALDGMAFVEQYREDRLRDPRILDFITRIEARVDPEIEAMGAAFRHAARIGVKTRDGREFTKEILHRRGSPENPLAPEDVVHKYRHVVKPVLSAARSERILELVQRLDTLEDVRPLIDIVAAPADAAAR
jgi:2-methylcitrate dehydratase PrpD